MGKPEEMPTVDEDGYEIEYKEFSRDIRCENITIAPIGGGTPLIHKSNLKLIHGYRYGLIGKNGAGKTTLLRHIEERDFPGFPEYLRVHLVEQEMEGTDLTVIETVMASDKEMTALIEEKETLLKILDAPEKIYAKDLWEYKKANGLLTPEEEAAGPDGKAKKKKSKKKKEKSS